MGHEGWNDNMELFNEPSCFFARKIAVVSVPVSHWADERLCVPCASKATALWFPPSERGLANSLFDSAAKFSNVIGAPLVAFLVTTFDWRVAFLTIGCINVLFTIFSGSIMNSLNGTNAFLKVN